jgi:hypothetical protein
MANSGMSNMGGTPRVRARRPRRRSRSHNEAPEAEVQRYLARNLGAHQATPLPSPRLLLADDRQPYLRSGAAGLLQTADR